METIYKITSEEILGTGWPDPEQLLFLILKNKGAPIDGTISFKIKPGYKWERFDDPLDRSITFKITEI